MTRWHKLRYGRIVASCECVSGDAADVLLAPHTPTELIVSDAQWRGTMYRKALLRQGTHRPDAEQRTADMRRRAQEIADAV